MWVDSFTAVDSVQSDAEMFYYNKYSRGCYFFVCLHRLFYHVCARCKWFDAASDWCVGWSETVRHYAPAPRVGSIKRWCASDVCLSVAYIGPKSRTKRPMKTKIGTEVGHVTRDSDTTFKIKGQRSTCKGRGHIVAAFHTACWRCHWLSCAGVSMPAFEQ